jgi:GT2 family glycosyltransferase
MIPRVAEARRIGGISAVVCNFQGEAYLEECLRSVLAQEGIDEVLLVDDASTDASVALVRERFPSVRVLELAENRGPCAARNAGMRAARHGFVLAVDNDAVLEPGVVQKLRAALEARPDCVAAQVRSVLADDPGRVHYDGASFHYVGLLSLRNFYRPVAESEGRGVVEVDALVAICVLVDRDAVLGAGGYDEDFFYLAEDYELSLRLRMQGARLLAVEDALVRHRGGTAGLSFRGGGYPERRVFLHSRNRWRVLAKLYSWRTLGVIAPALLLYEGVWLAFVLRQGFLRAHLAGKRAFLRELPRLLAARRGLARLRRVRDRELLVGGPLTFSPSLVASGPARAAAGALDLLLRAWWWIARPIAG